MSGEGHDPAACDSFLGASANDKLVMKWTAEWDRGNGTNWTDPSYKGAWTDNEWNGMVPGGSGVVWHYKIVWVGACTEGAYFDDGGYCIRGQFEVIMDQGTDNGTHSWLAKATPAGYGAHP